MKLCILLLALTATLFAQQSSVPEIPYHSVPDFLKLPPDLYFGEVAGVAVNSKGHIFVFSRGNSTGPAYGASAAQLFEFAPDGKYIREIGHNLYAWSFAHSVKIDQHDDIWVADKGSDTWDAGGNPYINDGYINSRIAKVDKDGNWLMSWGEPGSQAGQFNTPHSIAVDAEGKVCVADRGNDRIQVFDGNGKFLRQIVIDAPAQPGARPAIGNIPTDPSGAMKPGSPWAICITPPPNQVLYSSDAYPGRIYKLSLGGNLIGMLGKSGKQLGQFGWIHEMACPSENELYVAELLNWRVQKLILGSTK